MSTIPRPCINCGLVIPGHRRRCVECARLFEAARPGREAYRDAFYRSLRVPPGSVCHLCGDPGADTWDHIVPLSRGGTNDPGNLAPAHRTCNSRKGAGD